MLMHMCARLQESELLTSDMKVNRTANAFVVQEIGASPPPPPVPSTCLFEYSERSVASDQQDAARETPQKSHEFRSNVNIFSSLNS